MVTKLPSRWFDEHEAQFRRSAESHGINPRVVEAMISVETGGNNNLRGDGGRSHGILQILDGTDGYINSRHPGPRLERSKPEDAVEMSSWLLADMRDTYGAGDNYVKMMRGYNAGQGGFRRAGFSMEYSAYAAAYLAMRAQDTSNNPAEAREHAEYREALNEVLDGADQLGRGAEFRRMVGARISATSTLRGFGLHHYRTHGGSEHGSFAEYRAAAIGLLDDDAPPARAPRREAAKPDPVRDEHVQIIGDKDVVREVQRRIGAKVDGIWGRETTAKFREYESCNVGFTADGRITAAELRNVLMPVQHVAEVAPPAATPRGNPLVDMLQHLVRPR